jgi:hypothetical protein
MRVRSPSRAYEVIKMRTLALLLAAAVLMTPFAIAQEPEEKAADDPVAEEKVDVKALLKDYQAAIEANKKNAPARLSAVQKIAGVKDPAVGKALLSALKDRDPEVRAAAARGLAQQAGGKSDRSYGKALAGRLKKWDDDDPKAIEGILDGLAAFPSKGNIKTLTKIVEKVMYKESKDWLPSGKAAVKALGSIREKDAIEQLIKLLGMTNPRSGSGGPTISSETQAFRKEFENPVIASLGAITGARVKDGGVWTEWWRKVGKSYRVPKAGDEEELNKSPNYVDNWYGFRLKCPTGMWKYERPDKTDRVIRMRLPQVGNQQDSDIEIEVECFSQSKYGSGTTPPERVKYWLDHAKKTWKDVKKDSVTEVTLAGQKAKLLHILGQNAKGKTLVIDRYIWQKDGRLWTIHVTSITGVAKAHEDQAKKAIASFTFTK